MRTRIGRILTLAIAVSVAPAFAYAQTTVSGGGATRGPSGATGSSPSFEPGGIGPGGTAWSGSMPRQNVNMGRGGGPRSDNGLGLTVRPDTTHGGTTGGTPGTVTPPTQTAPGTSGRGTIGGFEQ